MDTFFPGISKETPVYELLAEHFMDNDTLYPAGSQIAYEGPPSEHMAPLNEAARVRMQAMLDELDEKARQKADLVGRPYRGRMTDLGDLIAQAQSDAKILQDRAQTETIKRALPTVPTGPVPVRPDMVPLADRRRAALAKSKVRASSPPGKVARAPTEPIHRMGRDQLTEKAPMEG